MANTNVPRKQLEGADAAIAFLLRSSVNGKRAKAAATTAVLSLCLAVRAAVAAANAIVAMGAVLALQTVDPAAPASEPIWAYALLLVLALVGLAASVLPHWGLRGFYGAAILLVAACLAAVPSGVPI